MKNFDEKTKLYKKGINFFKKDDYLSAKKCFEKILKLDSTNKESMNSLGVIYIVRDPRKILKSYANHSEITLEEAQKRILNFGTIGGKSDPINQTVIRIGSWASNYNSWKEFKKNYLDVFRDNERWSYVVTEAFSDGLSEMRKQGDSYKNCYF